MAKVAFELRSSVADDFGGASASLPGGEAYDVGEALSAGDGKITLDPDQKDGDKGARDLAIVEMLDRHPAMKRTTVAEPSSGGSKGGRS